MENLKNVVILLTKCPSKQKSYGIRTEMLGKNHWTFTWAFPMKEEHAKHEGYDKTSIRGKIERSPEYPGCPFCGTSNIVVCNCGHLSCHYTVNGQFTCPWCGLQGTLGDYKGSKITAGMDA